MAPAAMISIKYGWILYQDQEFAGEIAGKPEEIQPA